MSKPTILVQGTLDLLLLKTLALKPMHAWAVGQRPAVFYNPLQQTWP